MNVETFIMDLYPAAVRKTVASPMECFSADVFIDEETASKITLRFGVYVNAQQEADIEQRFVHAKAAADKIEIDNKKNGSTKNNSTVFWAYAAEYLTEDE